MIRLEEKPFELEGKRYLLRCNMAVLETIEEQYGTLDELMAASVRDGSLSLLAAMLNDYADDQGWEERWTPAQLKRLISHAMLMELDLVSMLFRSLSPARKENTPEAGSAEPADSGN